MKKIVLFLFISIPFLAYGQVNLSKEEIKQKTDSILAEGNLLYRYERVAWVSNDHALEISLIRKKFGGYLVYQSGDSIKAIILEKGQNNCIYEMTYFQNYSVPMREVFATRKLNDLEEKLQSIKIKITNQVFTPAYKVTCAEGYNLNIDLIPVESGYKLYILTGTSKPEVIPMGNDYVFFTDKNGEITSWRKFHSRLIPAMTKIDGEKVRGLTHSHLRTEPFISATDICTFKLYGGMYGLKQFKVLSTALSKYFTYDSEKNTIETEDE